MAKISGKRHGERFEAAVAAGNDEKAEHLVKLLTVDALPTLQRMLDGNGDRRWWAIRGLALVGNDDTAHNIAPYIHDADPAIRAAAVMALGTLHQKAPQAVNAHQKEMAALLSDNDGLVRRTAVHGLALCGDDAVEVLSHVLKSDQDGIRAHAAAALHQIGTRKTAVPLYHHLEDPNPLVRHHAYETLNDLGLLSNVLVTR